MNTCANTPVDMEFFCKADITWNRLLIAGVWENRVKNKNRKTTVLTMVHPRSKEHAIIKNQQNKLNTTSGKCFR